MDDFNMSLKMKQRQRDCIRFESVRFTRCPFKVFLTVHAVSVIVWHAQVPVRHCHVNNNKACLHPKKGTRKQLHETT